MAGREDVGRLTVDGISELLTGLAIGAEDIKKFQDEQIDGEAYLLLRDGNNLNQLNLALGPRMKISGHLKSLDVPSASSACYAVRVVNISAEVLVCTIHGLALDENSICIEIPAAGMHLIQYSTKSDKMFHLEIKMRESNSVLFTGEVDAWFELQVQVGGTIQCRQPEKWLRSSERPKRAAFLEFMKKGDHYEVLGLRRAATQHDIHQAYRRLMRIHHPDRNSDSLESTIITQRIIEAHTILSDVNNRNFYDKLFTSLDRLSALSGKEGGWWILVPLAFIVGGVATICICGTPLIAAMAGGALIGSGIGGTHHLMSEKVADEGIGKMKLVSVLALGAVAGAAATPVVLKSGEVIARKIVVAIPEIPEAGARLVAMAISRSAGRALPG